MNYVFNENIEYDGTMEFFTKIPKESINYQGLLSLADTAAYLLTLLKKMHVQLDFSKIEQQIQDVRPRNPEAEKLRLQIKKYKEKKNKRKARKKTKQKNQ